jgi:glyoxylase-like metal-dependent hydrolase (beta-lactamase superfamily II)
MDLDLGLNWKALHGEEIEIFKDVFLYHLPGHTPGLCSMRVTLQKSGDFIFTSDLCHLKENFEKETILGWLLEDRLTWLRSVRKLKAIARNYKATVVYGHDIQRLEELKKAPQYYE